MDRAKSFDGSLDNLVTIDNGIVIRNSFSASLFDF
jgi:hypothetical protein